MRYSKQEGHKSNITQKLANKLQPWNKIRTDQESNGFSFLNAFGIQFQEKIEQIGEFSANRYIGTADTMVRWEAYTCKVPSQLVKHPVSNSNLLWNADFFLMGMAHRDIPLDWSVTNGAYYSEDACYGSGCVRLQVDDGATGELSQDVEEVSIKDGDEFVGSIYIKATGEVEPEDPNTKLVISTYRFGTLVDTEYTNLPLATDGEWTRYSVSLTATDYAGDIELRVVVPNSSGSSLEIKLGAPMVTKGSELLDWQQREEDIQDQLFRVYISAPDGTEQEKRELHQVNDLFDFYEYAIPTRVNLSAWVTGDVMSKSSGPLYYEWDGKVWKTDYEIISNQICLTNRDVPGEIIETFTILDRYIDNFRDETGEFGVLSEEEGDFSRVWEAVTVLKEYIYAIALETKASITKRILKVIKRSGINSMLEVVRDFPVGINTGSVTAFAFVDGHMDQMYLQIDTTTEWKINLVFDIFYYDTRANFILTRHPYPGYTLKFVEL